MKIERGYAGGYIAICGSRWVSGSTRAKVLWNLALYMLPGRYGRALYYRLAKW